MNEQIQAIQQLSTVTGLTPQLLATLTGALSAVVDSPGNNIEITGTEGGQVIVIRDLKEKTTTTISIKGQDVKQVLEQEGRPKMIWENGKMRTEQS